jgi:hypothetical protein
VQRPPIKCFWIFANVLVAGIFVDAVLVITPIRVLQGLKSAPQLKRRLIIIFCASLFMTLACIVQSVITITLPGDPELIASLTEVRRDRYP